MKQLLSFLLISILALSLTACGNGDSQSSRTGQTSAAPSSTSAPAQSNSPGSEPEGQDTGVESQAEANNILIAYFTWADNTHVENPEAVDVDAVTSASVLVPGNTAKLAGWIQEATGGDLFSITTVEPYSSDYDTCLNRAIDEHDSNARPALTTQVENTDDYDIVFLGFPNWWYSCPMAILTFIEENDLSGKTIVPFCAHGTGGFAASLRDIGNVLPKDCTVLKAFGAYRPDVDTAQPKINEWLAGLNIEF